MNPTLLWLCNLVDGRHVTMVHELWPCSLSHWKYDKRGGCLPQSCTFPMKLRMKRAWGFYNEGGGGCGFGGISFVGLFVSRAILALWLGWTMCYHDIRTLALFSSLLNARCSHSPIELNFLFLLFGLPASLMPSSSREERIRSVMRQMRYSPNMHRLFHCQIPVFTPLLNWTSYFSLSAHKLFWFLCYPDKKESDLLWCKWGTVMICITFSLSGSSCKNMPLDHSFFDAFAIQIRIIQTCGETDEEQSLTLGDRMKLFDPPDKKNRICGKVG